MTHTHNLVFLGDLTEDKGASRPVYCCRECGTCIEKFDMQIAEFVPEWSAERLGKEKSKYVCTYEHPNWKITDGLGAKQKKRGLGKGLRELRGQSLQLELPGILPLPVK